MDDVRPRPATRVRHRPRRWSALIGAAGLICGLFAATTPPTVGAAETAARQEKSRVVVLAAPSLVEAGSPVVVKAVVRPRRAGRWTRLEVRRGGAWARVDRRRQNARGRVRLVLRRPAVGTHRLRVVAAGPRPARSPVVVSRVAVPRIALWVPMSARGDDTTVTAGVRPARPGVQVALQERGPEGWATVDTAPQDADGRAVLTLSQPTGTHELRAVAAAPPGTVSPTARTRVAADREPVQGMSQQSMFQLYGADLSGDGRWIAIATPDGPDAPTVKGTAIVVVDRVDQTSITLPLARGQLTSEPSLSADGRFVAYNRSTPRPQTSALRQIVVADLVTGSERTFDRIDGYSEIQISADGRHVLAEGSSELPCRGGSSTPLDDEGHVVKIDVLTGTARCLTVPPAASGHNSFRWPTMSGDGRTVAMMHDYVDMRTGAERRGIRLWLPGATRPRFLALGRRARAYPSLSHDGSTLFFSLMRPGSEWVSDVYVRDLRTGETTTPTARYETGGSMAGREMVSADGRFVFFGGALELAPGREWCVHRYDLRTDRVVTMACEASSHWEAVSDDGRTFLTEMREEYEPMTVFTRGVQGGS